ncbi:MAG TPA: HAMP domain-containing protein [Candidatus Merdisoma merdipullorum]|nr:HAMP domain-containing protein [Candidatus Merdisoma merdipullorum]
MKHSIKRQLAGIFIGVMAGTFLCCGLANVLFLERYYVDNKKKAVISAYEVLNQGVGAGRTFDSSFTSELELICNTDNISLFVMDNSGEPMLSTNRDYQMLQRKLYSYIFEIDTREIVVLERTDTYVLRESKDYLTQADYLEIVGTLDSGQPFIMQTALESIRESAAISTRFFMYIACLAVILSSVLIWWLSRRISEPILELTDISRRMTELDFNAKFTSNVQNEIGVLGHHINQLSGNLEKTISELKTANNELQRDIEQKTKIDEMRKEFLSNVSHELKTPIALIQGYAEGLKECINDDAESRDFYCEVIMDEAGKMNTMVKNLLSLNQLEFGNDVVSMERFDIVSLIRNVLNSAKILMEQKDIHLIFKETEEIYVWSDEFKIEEVVTNYISNAINHCEFDKVIEVKVIKEPDMVRVSVFNTGRPIPEEDLDKIWQKFYKVDKARTREYGGSGIGLSIVKAIMESLHRECGVKNYDNGVEFWFELDAKVN